MAGRVIRLAVPSAKPIHGLPLDARAPARTGVKMLALPLFLIRKLCGSRARNNFPNIPFLLGRVSKLPE
jgi:hypothetical protein